MFWINRGQSEFIFWYMITGLETGVKVFDLNCDYEKRTEWSHKIVPDGIEGERKR